MRAPIHSVKHYVQMSLTSVASGATVNTVLVNGQLLQNVNAVNEVSEGALVKAVYIELWTIGDSAAATEIVVLAKFVAGAAPFSVTELAALGVAPNKKNILFTHQGLNSNNGIAAPIPVMRGWYKIPKSKQRFSIDDTLELQVFSQAQGLVFCGFATYKEYT